MIASGWRTIRKNHGAVATVLAAADYIRNSRPALERPNFRAIGFADCDVIEPLRREGPYPRKDGQQRTRYGQRQSASLDLFPRFAGLAFPYRNTEGWPVIGPEFSHWPAESSANNVAAIGDVSAPTPSWYTPKPMEFHRAARRQALSLRQTWRRL